MNRFFRPVISVASAILLMTFGCQRQSGDLPGSKTRVTILAAASLRECVDELVSASGLAGDAGFVVSTGASGSLAQQIQSGSEADLFLSANGDWARAVVDQFPAAEKKIVAGNTLVLIGRPGSPVQIRSAGELAGKTELRIGIAGPEVPAGKYARQALQSAGVLEGLVRSNRLVIGQDVRQVLRWVEMGEVDAGLVYRTDLAVAGSVIKLLDIDPNSHDPVEYWLVLLNRKTATDQAATKLYEWFSSEGAKKILDKRGFLAR